MGASRDDFTKYPRTPHPFGSHGADDDKHLGHKESLDQGEVIQAARETCREHLRCRHEFAFNAMNTVRQTRKRWIALFADYRARVDFVSAESPLSVVFQQDERRARRVPKQVIRRLWEGLEPPKWAEAHSVSLVG